MKIGLLKKAGKRALLPLLLLLVLGSGILLASYMNKLTETTMEFTVGYMKELAEHDALNVNDKIQGYHESLLETAETIRTRKPDSMEDATEILQLKRLSHNLKDLFLIDSDGTTYNFNNIIENRSDKDYVRSICGSKEEYIAKVDSSSAWYDWNNSMRLAYPIDPIRIGDKEIIGICGEYPFELIGSSLQLESFGGKGVSTLIDMHGNVLSQTGIVTQQPVEDNFFQDLKKEYKLNGDLSIDALISDINAMNRVEFQYELDGVKYLCITIPITDLRLTLISSVPVEVANLQYSQMLRLTLLTVSLIAIIILILSFAIYYFSRSSVMLKAQKTAAEEIAASKSMFLSNMSHEIRTPLNAILGFSELLSKSESVSEQDKVQVEKIETSSKFLISLVNDILDMSRIDSGRMELFTAPVSLDELIDDINVIVDGRANQVGLRYNCNNDCKGIWVCGDVTRIQQILMNLLANSFKFTPKDGEICLDVLKLSEDSGSVTVRFVVSDTGCGMSKEFLTHLFEPFVQEQRKNVKKQTGTGLGLSICNELVTLMSGRIKVESVQEKGSKFTVDIPFEKAEPLVPKGTREINPEDTDWSGVTVLVVEDNELNMEILTYILESHNIMTIRASDGQEALDIFSSSNPGDISLILMDMQMPVMDGLEASERIRLSNHPCAKSVPILAVTANAFTSDVELAIAHGMNDHISKPIDTKQLFGKLHKYLFDGGVCDNA